MVLGDDQVNRAVRFVRTVSAGNVTEFDLLLQVQTLGLGYWESSNTAGDIAKKFVERLASLASATYFGDWEVHCLRVRPSGFILQAYNDLPSEVLIRRCVERDRS